MKSEEEMNEDGHSPLLNSEPKLQFRNDIYKARWDAELGMAEVIEKKGVMWKTMGIFRWSKHYFSIEETLFLAERGALLLLDEKDTIFTLKNIYKMVAEANNGCCWESFKAFRHLKSLGYIVARHGVPWTLKNDNKSCEPTRPQGIPESDTVSGREMEDTISVSSLLQSMQINNLRLAFDVYLPNSNFRISSPGDPDFVLCIARDPPSKIEIENLERRCNGVPLKICNVEHGLFIYEAYTPFAPLLVPGLFSICIIDLKTARDIFAEDCCSNRLRIKPFKLPPDSNNFARPLSGAETVDVILFNPLQIDFERVNRHKGHLQFET
ncbi:hypothetical protein IFM89_029766 [Coptis chinensis]|uniref:tRNA-splicing endonuclease subunit Sen54 N-terminal domain-containing protein n=1 Tax=Coptis chinensis TaxID=261450 RepID=A0A835IG09_9MAGN|nr:hypothetical protein IFM89_029766 [Coptis chinensis]